MAKDRKARFEPGDTVELADKETGFSDPVTGFKVVRDGKVKLGDTIGSKTNRALLSGALLIVGGKAEKAKPAEDGNGKPAAAAKAGAKVPPRSKQSSN